MNKDSGVFFGLLAIAGGLFYVGSELNKNRRMREASVKSKDKKQMKKENKIENRVIAGFKQAAQLK